MQQSQDPRATVIKNLTQQQLLIDEALKEIPPIEQITFDILMDVFDKCFDIRQQPEFIQAIFNKNQIYEEFVLWILDPITIIEKRKISGNQVSQQSQRKYPYTCMKIARENNLFYIHLYLKAYFDQKAFKLWFEFLSNANMDTFYTSLGYFTQIMMPFLKYEFSQCTKICQQLMQSCDEEFLMSSSVISRQQTQVSKERLMMSSKKKKNDVEKQISILVLFTDQLLEFIFCFIQHQVIFKFVHNLILVSLEESDLKRSKKVFENFLRKALEKDKDQQTDINLVTSMQKASIWLQKQPLTDICVEYILQVIKEIYDNANTDKNYRVIFFIDSLVRLDVIGLFIERIQQSPLMVKQSASQQKLTGSVDFTAIVNQEDFLEYFIKSLTLMVKIFSKMSKNKKTNEQVQRESKYYGQSSQQQEEISGENKVMKEFSLQICNIFNKLPQLSQLVKKSQSRVIAFSSGQNIKPITMCKYEFFQLLYTCLLLSKQFPDCFVLDTEKINIFSIIQRYLQENRWNNLAHKVLEKIACLLIINNKNFFRTKEMNKNNMADEFLNTIIESFTNKKHIFLKSLRFTTQGNLHTLYTIAKAIINKLKQTHNLANFVHQLDYYKKFVMEDLQQYQKKIKQIQYPADEQDIIIDNKNAEENDQVKLYIDEISVSQIVKKIDIVCKWPLKQAKRKHGSFIHRSLSYMSDQHQSNSSVIERKKRQVPPSQQILNTQDEDSDTTSKFRNHIATSPRIMMKSESRDFSKTAQQGSGFYKQSIKKVDSVLHSPDKIKHQGQGMFGQKSINLKDKISIQLFGQGPYNINEQIEQFRYNDSGRQNDFNGLQEQKDNGKNSRTESCPLEKKKNSLKQQQGRQDFIEMCNSNHSSPAKAQVIGSDHRVKKITSIESKSDTQHHQKHEKFNSTQ